MDSGQPTISWLSDFLGEDDDPELWRIALAHILGELEKEPHMVVEVGRCSHWLRPHQSRWTAGGGFPWPTGYGGGNGGHNNSALPQFDWSDVLGWTGSAWEPIKRQSIRHAVRVAIPSRTKRHQQAAIHTLWHTGKEKETKDWVIELQDISDFVHEQSLSAVAPYERLVTPREAVYPVGETKVATRLSVPDG